MQATASVGSRQDPEFSPQTVLNQLQTIHVWNNRVINGVHVPSTSNGCPIETCKWGRVGKSIGHPLDDPGMSLFHNYMECVGMRLFSSHENHATTKEEPDPSSWLKNPLPRIGRRSSRRFCRIPK